MEEKAILEAMDKGFASVGGKLEAQIAELNETAKKVLVKPEDVLSPAQLKEEEDKAKLAEAGIVGGITDFKVWDIPVGQALVGGFAAVFASELIDGFLIKQGDWTKGVVKLMSEAVRSSCRTAMSVGGVEVRSMNRTRPSRIDMAETSSGSAAAAPGSSEPAAASAGVGGGLGASAPGFLPIESKLNPCLVWIIVTSGASNTTRRTS